MTFNKKLILTVLAIGVGVFITLLATLYISDTSGIPDDYDILTIESKVLLETREIIVKTPRNYNKDKTYPVVYVVGSNSLTFYVD